ncbi:uncharacterized protein [Typha angustifolia]|uniref:uncharacterized protein n=1 Tax=Typha angustifolia TaxID=59011 RepID=UPI003C2F57C0
MMRQSSSRNQRARSQRVKNVLQMCILAAVFLWLLYQLKHSYDKQQSLVEKSSSITNNIDEIPQGLIKLGRKDLPHREETGSLNKEDENDEIEEGQEEKERDVRGVIEEEESVAGRDDEIGEQDQERGNEEDEQQRADEEAEDEDDKDAEEAEEAGLDGLDHEEDSRLEHEVSAVLREKLDVESDNNWADEELKSTEEGDDKDDKDDSEDNAADADLVGSQNTTTLDKRELAAGLNKTEGSTNDNKGLQINSTTATVSDNLLATNNSETETSLVHQETANILLLQNQNITTDSTQEQHTNIQMEAHEEDQSNSEDHSIVNLADEDSAAHKMVAGSLVDLSTLPETQHELIRNVDDEVAEQR